MFIIFFPWIRCIHQQKRNFDKLLCSISQNTTGIDLKMFSRIIIKQVGEIGLESGTSFHSVYTWLGVVFVCLMSSLLLLQNATIYSPQGDISISCLSMLCLLWIQGMLTTLCISVPQLPQKGDGGHPHNLQVSILLT